MCSLLSVPDLPLGSSDRGLCRNLAWGVLSYILAVVLERGADAHAKEAPELCALFNATVRERGLIDIAATTFARADSEPTRLHALAFLARVAQTQTGATLFTPYAIQALAAAPLAPSGPEAVWQLTCLLALARRSKRTLLASKGTLQHLLASLLAATLTARSALELELTLLLLAELLPSMRTLSNSALRLAIPDLQQGAAALIASLMAAGTPRPENITLALFDFLHSFFVTLGQCAHARAEALATRGAAQRVLAAREPFGGDPLFQRVESAIKANCTTKLVAFVAKKSSAQSQRLQVAALRLLCVMCLALPPSFRVLERAFRTRGVFKALLALALPTAPPGPEGAGLARVCAARFGPDVARAVFGVAANGPATPDLPCAPKDVAAAAPPGEPEDPEKLVSGFVTAHFAAVFLLITAARASPFCREMLQKQVRGDEVLRDAMVTTCGLFSSVGFFHELPFVALWERASGQPDPRLPGALSPPARNPDIKFWPSMAKHALLLSLLRLWARPGVALSDRAAPARPHAAPPASAKELEALRAGLEAARPDRQLPPRSFEELHRLMLLTVEAPPAALSPDDVSLLEALSAVPAANQVAEGLARAHMSRILEAAPRKLHLLQRSARPPRRTPRAAASPSLPALADTEPPTTEPELLFRPSKFSSRIPGIILEQPAPAKTQGGPGGAASEASGASLKRIAGVHLASTKTHRRFVELQEHVLERMRDPAPPRAAEQFAWNALGEAPAGHRATPAAPAGTPASASQVRRNIRTVITKNSLASPRTPAAARGDAASAGGRARAWKYTFRYHTGDSPIHLAKGDALFPDMSIAGLLASVGRVAQPPRARPIGALLEALATRTKEIQRALAVLPEKTAKRRRAQLREAARFTHIATEEVRNLRQLLECAAVPNAPVAPTAAEDLTALRPPAHSVSASLVEVDAGTLEERAGSVRYMDFLLRALVGALSAVQDGGVGSAGAEHVLTLAELSDVRVLLQNSLKRGVYLPPPPPGAAWLPERLRTALSV